MENFKSSREDVFKLIIVLLAGAIVISGSPFFVNVKIALFEVLAKQEEFEGVQNQDMSLFPVSQNNSLFPFSSPHFVEFEVIRLIPVIVTGYSSTPFETDDDPFITAAGTTVRRGVVANNLLPFGTKIRLPEIYDEEIFVIEDRMHRRKSDYHIDIWFSSYEEALNFGARRTYIEVIGG